VRLDNPAIFGEVAVGPGDELFLLSKRHETLNYVSGRKRATQREIDDFHETLIRRRKHATGIGARYFHLVAPDKHAVYDASFPIPIDYRLGAHYASCIPSDLLEYPVSRLQSLLPERVYRKTDSHWSLLGSIAIAAFIAARMGISEPIVADGLREMREAMRTEKKEFSGDLGSKLEPNHREPLQTLVADWEVEEAANVVPGNEGVFRIFKSSHSQAKGRMVIFGDSFSFQALLPLSRYFHQILCCRTRNYHHEIVSMARPDFVLTQNVERYLSSPGNDKTASTFFLIPQLIGREISYSVPAAKALAEFLSFGNIGLGMERG